MRLPSSNILLISEEDLMVFKSLDGQTLAALGATTRQNGTAALGRHTSTEAVRLRTLASVRLISAFHIFTFHLVFRATVRLYYGALPRQQIYLLFKTSIQPACSHLFYAQHNVG